MSRIPNFERLLAEQVKQDEADRAAKKKANRKASNRRYHEKHREERNERNRIQYLARKQARQPASSEGKIKRATTNLEVQAIKPPTSKSVSTEALPSHVAPPHRLEFHAIRKCDGLEAPAIFLALKDCSFYLDQCGKDAAVEYQKFGDMLEAMQYICNAGATVNASCGPSNDAPASQTGNVVKTTAAFTEIPEPVPVPVGCPGSLRNPTKTDTAKAKAAEEGTSSTKTSAAPPADEESETYTQEDKSTCSHGFQIVSFAKTSETIHPYLTTISTPLSAVQGMVQVLNCAVLLVNGIVTPIKYLKRAAPSTQLATLGFAQTTIDLEFEDPSPILQPEDRIIDMKSFRSFLLAKSKSKHYLWKYNPHEGSFIGPVSFDMDSGGVVGIVDGAVVGFDTDLLKNNVSVLRKVDYSFEQETGKEGTISVLGESVDENMVLFKNRVKAKIVPGYGGASAFIFAQRVVRKGVFAGSIYAAQSGKIAKIGKFPEGTIADIASDGKRGFACTGDGEIFYSKYDQWVNFEGVQGVSSVSACDGCCVGVKGSQALFLIPEGDKGRILEQDLSGKIAFFDGSGSYASFLVAVDSEDKVSEDLTKT